MQRTHPHPRSHQPRSSLTRLAVATWIMHINSFEARRAQQQSSGSPLAQDRKLKASHTRLLKHTVCSVYADGGGSPFWGFLIFLEFCSEEYETTIRLGRIALSKHAKREP